MFSLYCSLNLETFTKIDFNPEELRRNEGLLALRVILILCVFTIFLGKRSIGCQPRFQN